MSYALDLTSEARIGLASLPSRIQEDVLDLIEELLDKPASLVPRGASPLIVRDLVRFDGGVKYYVFLLLKSDLSRRMLRVDAIGHAIQRYPSN